MSPSYKRSREIFDRSQEYLPGGVNSPVRAFHAVGMRPLVIERGEGAYLYDVDGNRFTDYVCSWGPLILGHAYPAVNIRDGVAVAKDIRFHPYPVVRLHTADGLTVAMTKVDFMPDCPNSVFLKTVDLDKVRQITSEHEGVHFPMFEIDQTSELSWMFGLQAAKNVQVVNANTRIRLKVSSQGQGRQLMSVGGINSVQMNSPFLFWIRLDGAALPVVAAVICPDAWRKPDKER